MSRRKNHMQRLQFGIIYQLGKGCGIYIDKCIEFLTVSYAIGNVGKLRCKENYLIQQMNLLHMSGGLFTNNKFIKTCENIVNVFFYSERNDD